MLSGAGVIPEDPADELPELDGSADGEAPSGVGSDEAPDGELPDDEASDDEAPGGGEGAEAEAEVDSGNGDAPTEGE